MTICLVTDRRRANPVAQARAAVEAGVDLIQVRERDLDGAALCALVRAVVDVAKRSALARGTSRWSLSSCLPLTKNELS